MKRGFGSDNHSGIHPDILNSIQNINFDHEPSYGTDPYTDIAIKCFQDHFGPSAQVNFVFNGTAANILSLRSLAKPFQSVFCTDISHIHVDECAGPELIASVKLLALPSKNGKFDVDTLEKQFIRRGDQHYSQTSIISLTQPTELGTLYSIAELQRLVDWAKSKKLLIHMDGARIANAAVQLNKGFKEFTTDLGVDVVSFGGTKNGLMFGEAVVSLNPIYSTDIKYLRKQMAQLPSKSRFIASQFSAYFQNDLWKKIAQHSCNMAKTLESEIRKIPSLEITQPVESNAVFLKIPKNLVKPLREKYFFYVWDEFTFECRLMTSWDTQETEILGFCDTIKELL